MKTPKSKYEKTPHWFVCSKHEHNSSRLNSFINEGYWKYYNDEVKENTRYLYLGYLEQIAIDHRIAIYELGSETPDEFKEKHNVQISRKSVTYLVIKAVGRITKPCYNNCIVGVDWKKVNDSRRWYSYTYPGQIWIVYPKSNQRWGDNLIKFTFDGAQQDLERLYSKVKPKAKN